ncbi:hypothetical protein C8F01DRAFT_500668 [Mycena amicta]|nr:hypothetical protein C8F01DRAFT_500668 [Mycena amicta]
MATKTERASPNLTNSDAQAFAAALRSLDNARATLLRADPRAKPPMITIAEADRRTAGLRADIAALEAAATQRDIVVDEMRQQAATNRNMLQAQKQAHVEVVNRLKRQHESVLQKTTAEFKDKLAALEEKQETTAKELENILGMMRGNSQRPTTPVASSSRTKAALRPRRAAAKPKRLAEDEDTDAPAAKRARYDRSPKYPQGKEYMNYETNYETRDAFGRRIWISVPPKEE